MCIIDKVFRYEETDLPIIEYKDEVWFRGKTVAEILRYAIQHKAIREHVDPEDKRKLSELGLKSRGSKTDPLTNNEKNAIYINESGLYSLILRSKLESAHIFKRWVTKDVLPSIRKTGWYEYNHKPFKMLTFNIQSEYDLHKKVVNYIRNHHPKALLNASLGEKQINSDMRLRSYNMGYQKGSPDLIIQNLHKVYSGFAIEFKNPRGNGQLSEDQKVMLQEYRNNSFKVLVSNDYDEILEEIIHYFDGVRIKCNHCSRKFKSSKTLKNHLKYIHKHL